MTNLVFRHLIQIQQKLRLHDSTAAVFARIARGVNDYRSSWQAAGGFGVIIYPTLIS